MSGGHKKDGGLRLIIRYMQLIRLPAALYTVVYEWSIFTCMLQLHIIDLINCISLLENIYFAADIKPFWFMYEQNRCFYQ